MKGKIFLALFIVLSSVSFVLASDVAYVVKHSGNPNSNLITALNEIGKSHDVIDDYNIPTTDFSNYKLIIIGDGTLTNYNLIPVNLQNSIILNSNRLYLLNWKISYNSGTTVSNTYTTGQVNQKNVITQGLNDTFRLYVPKSIGAIHLITKASGMKNLVGTNDYDDLTIVGSLDVGDNLYGSGKSMSRTIFFGINQIDSWTTDSRSLFKNSLLWLFKEQCTDVDGDYYVKENVDVGVCDAVCGPNHDEACLGNNDCSDNDPNKYQIINGYKDTDLDGIGAGDLLQVCSGESLPVGYVSENSQHEDCNDTNPNLFQLLQGYKDSDLDGIGAGELTLVCSGEELPSGYVPPGVANTDCNDSNPNTWQLINGYRDADLDGIGAGDLLQVCSGESLPVGYVNETAPHDDCNDTNMNLFQLLQGYKDTDLDGVGAGELTLVCSGEELPSGYVPPGVANTDCNDTNPDVWQLIKGYVDNDMDGFGTGNLIDVCSGNIYPEGYSNINGDCNDSSSDIFPGAIDIPYDGVDQSCQGFDVADVDSDGYCKAGYLIQNASLQCPLETGPIGTDCNDNDPNVNPGSEDVFSNCKNDAPIIDMNDSFSFSETDRAEIIVNAIDPENDNLTYSINDSRFTQDRNVFRWQTNYGDKGNYEFNVSVSDGILTTSKIIDMEVTFKKRLPVCNNIPELVWNEDGNASLNLNDYCYSPDNLTLSYSIYQTSGNDNIDLVSLDNGTAVFTSQLYWYGKDWLVFDVSDGIDDIVTNTVNLTVNHVNHIPILNKQIENITWNQNSNLTNKINLYNYFKDFDNDNLTFRVTGNQNIGVVINSNGLVSFNPPQEYYGEENVTFSASDANGTVYSNSVYLKVLYLNKPPKFGAMNCLTEFAQYQQQTCDINVSDVENDSISVKVLSNNNLNCTIENNTIIYTSAGNYNGTASCTIRANDSYSYSDYVLNVFVDNINDPPTITNFNPIYGPKLMENTLKLFNIEYYDVDSAANVNWLLNDNFTANGDSYSFSQPKGRYNLTAVVSDGEFNVSHSWDVFVGNIHDFTCNEVSGFICDSDHVCKGDILGVYNTDNCCSVPCSVKPPEFKAIKKQCTNMSSDIELLIRNQSSLLTFKTGETMKPRILIINNLGKDKSFIVQSYLYDLTKNKVVGKTEGDLSITNSNSEEYIPEIDVPTDVDESDTFFFFVEAKTNDKDKNCSQIYDEIQLNRVSHQLLIDSVKLQEEDNTILCGDFINLNVNLANVGSNDENVIISVDNSQLNMHEKSDNFKIEKYGNSDVVGRNFFIKFPDNAKEGNYTLVITASYGTGTETYQKELDLGECKVEKTEIQTVDTISINRVNNTPVIKKSETSPLIFILITSVGVLFVFLIIVYLVGRHNKINMINSQFNLEPEVIIDKKTKTRKKRK